MELREQARLVAKNTLIVDTHLDVPERMLEKAEDISTRTPDGDFDYVRAREGGLRVPFMAVFIPSSFEGTGKAKAHADLLIDTVRSFASRWPDKFGLVCSAADVLKSHPPEQILIAMGMENGTALEGSLDNVRYFFDRGIRYITLTHSRCNHICDSSFDPERKWNGLSPFGASLIAEMNRVGMIIDVSHVSDSAFYQVLRLSKAPVVATHSSCRAFTPGFERNMSDDMIRALAGRGGVIQINFGSAFLRDDIRREPEEREKSIDLYLTARHIDRDSTEGKAYAGQYRRDHPLHFADVADVARHIDHVVRLVGIDHVGLGSDFDGLGDSLPTGLKDVSGYPNLIYELLKLHYSDEDIQKICGGNFLRVWREIERLADTRAPQ